MDDLNIPNRDDVESFIIGHINAIYRSAHEAAKPYADQLYRLRMLAPPAPIFLTKEQADMLASYLPKQD